MNVLVILGHPHKGSFNHAIAYTAIDVLKNNGHSVVFHDLYEEGFDPVVGYEEIPRDGEIDSVIRTHCEHVTNADGIIIVHPNWWGQPPQF